MVKWTTQPTGAIELGYESELVYIPHPHKCWRVTVRNPGTKDPPFLTETASNAQKPHQQLMEDNFTRNLLLVHEAHDADLAATDDHGWWWTAVALRSAMAGAAVVLGPYGMALRTTEMSAKDAEALEHAGFADPTASFGAALDDVEAVRSAYRVLTLGLVGEIAWQLWRPDYASQMSAAVQLFRVGNNEAAEIRVIATVSEPQPPEQPTAEWLYLKQRQTFIAMLEAATGRAVADDNPWLGLPLGEPLWRQGYENAQDTVSERMQQLAPTGMSAYD